MHPRWDFCARAIVVFLASAIGVGCEELAPNPAEPPEHTRLSGGRGDPCRVDLSDRPTNGNFDRRATAEALGCVFVQDCRDPSDPPGSGHLRVRLAPDGSVASAEVDRPPFAGTKTGACVEQRFRMVRIPAFRGSAVTIGKSFSLE